MVSKKFNKDFLISVSIVFIMFIVLFVSSLFYFSLLSETHSLSAKVVYEEIPASYLGDKNLTENQTLAIQTEAQNLNNP
jgi:hypothetical protein